MHVDAFATLTVGTLIEARLAEANAADFFDTEYRRTGDDSYRQLRDDALASLDAIRFEMEVR